MDEVIAGRYEILELIGRGGMGTVYKARQRTLDRIVAVKMLSEELASDIEFRARFQQEAAVLAKLNHPAIVQIFDIETHGDTFCIIMEYVEGETLQAMVNRLGALPEHRMLALTAQVARGLAFAHRANIVHRDVKPDNILIATNGAARIMDFGIAHVAGSSLKTQTGISMGTPRYMSPEQVTGRGVDGQADLYCLGLCLYFGLTGQPPFDGENPVEIATKQVYEVPPHPSAIFTAISPATDDAVMRSIAKVKTERWPDGDSMADSLESVLRNRESFSRHAGIAVSGSDDPMGQTPSRIILGDPGRVSIPHGETQRVRTGTGSIRAPEADYETPGTDPAHRNMSNPTPIQGLIPLSPLPASVSDFEAPVHAGTTPPTGTPITPKPGTGANSFSPLAPNHQEAGGALDLSAGPSTKVWWIRGRLVFLILFSAAALSAGYYLRSGNSLGPIRTPSSGLLPGDTELHSLEQETMTAIGEGRWFEIIKSWQDFLERREREKPGDRAVDIGEEYIRWLKSQLPPLPATDELVRRRLDRAQYLLNIKRPAVAAAYTEKTVDLFGRSSSYNERVEVLRRLIDRDNPMTDPTRVGKLLSQATQARNAVAIPNQGPLIHPDERRAEALLLEAVQSDPKSFEAWMAGGKFYAQHRYQDDARVFFMTAIDRAETGEERGTATQHLEALPGQ